MILGIFRKSKSEPVRAECEALKEKSNENIVKIQEKPKIFLIDFDPDTSKKLQDKGLNVTKGSLGKKIHVPNTARDDPHPCLLNSNIPENLHEYQIVIVNLQENDLLEYNPKDHLNDKISNGAEKIFICEYPQTIFNPKPICGAYFLMPHLDEILKRQGILIIFSNRQYYSDYQPVTITSHHTHRDETIKLNNYAFVPQIPFPVNKFGKEMVVQEGIAIASLLKRYLPDATYDVTFTLPTVLNQEKNGAIPDPHFSPLIWNHQQNIVSFVKDSGNGTIFLFPNIKDKSSFLVELLTEVLPSAFPEIFPTYSKYRWLQESTYTLPNENELLQRKDEIINKYDDEISRINLDLEGNHKKYECLHNLLINDEKTLVKDVESFLKWLGFTDVKNMDEIHPEKLEEDLQIDLKSGLIIIEVKGIGGTSTDEQCSQISKNVLRRHTERGKTDVYGVYIVNHQKHLPPLDRKNPPFTETQITDSEYDHRGLLTTWQLFNLYFSIKSGAITKEDARNAFQNSGLIEFFPQNAVSLGKPKDVLKDGKVILLDLKMPIRKTGNLFIKRDERYYPVKICEIRIDNKLVDSAESCGVGIRVDIITKNTDEIFYRNSL
jgi:hypothetical protein